VTALDDVISKISSSEGVFSFDHLERARVLIVDDEQHNRDLLEAMLSAEGFELATSATAEQALEIVRERPPDLILLDVMMPGMDGYELTRTIKSSPISRNIPIIICSALDGREARILGLRAGAEDFLSKPIDRAELCARVRNLLRLKAYGDYYGRYSEILENEVTLRTADLVERSRALEAHGTALERSEERINYALGAANMGIWELDLQTQQVTWSETMAAVFGLPDLYVPATPDEFFELVHPDDRQLVARAATAARSAGTGYEVEFRLLREDGSQRWVSSRAQMVTDAANTPVRLLGVSSDISERKSLEAQLRQSQKMDAVGQLAGGVAHDFNNILTAILGYSNLVIETLEASDPRHRDLVQVLTAGERAAGLTRQLLAFSRKQILQPTTVDLNALVSGMRPMLSRLIGEHVDLVPSLAPGLGVVRADLGQFEQVLMNLVVNARDAMPAGGRLTVETANVELDQSFMQHAVIEPGPYVMLAVSDTGIGMTETVKHRLFEPFFTTKEQGKGTGLGLAMVYGIVKQSGGYIWVYSEPGKGSAFKVYLPRVTAEAAPIASAPVSAATAIVTETVLIVEDDDAVRSLLRTMLERAGYRVLDAARPEHAHAIFEQHDQAIDLLVADVIMPGSSGPALYRQLTAQSPSLKVLFVSGFTDDTVFHQGQLDPEVEFLQKPFTAGALHERVREVLDR
jgi:PAS domain S-box-containing protein